jgi:hypothetical protein
MVKTKKQRIIWSGDTLIIRTDSLNTKPHGDATEIFDKIDGLNINNGLVSILGEYIGTISIDGRKIFGGIPIMTLNAIRADMIQQIEVIERINEFGAKEKTVNIRLKANRKKGFYGDIEAGYGSMANNLIASKYNKLGKYSFTNIFLNYNTINEKRLDNIDFDRVLYNSIRKYASNQSIIGLYDRNTEKPNISQLTDKVYGLNKLGGAGVNWTYNKNKTQFDVFMVFNDAQKQYTERQLTKNFLGSDIQQVDKKSTNLDERKYLNLSLSGKVELDKKTTFQFTQQVSLEEEKKNRKDTLLSKIDVFQNKYILGIAESKYKSSYGVQSSITRRAHKKGINTTLYLDAKFGMSNNDIFFTNQSLNYSSSQVIDKQFSNKTLNIELIQSYPIGKTLLLEAKIGQFYEKIFLGQRNNDTSENQFRLADNQQTAGISTLYQKKQWSIICALNYWNLFSERSKNGINDNVLFSKFPNFLNRINYKLTNSSSISLRYETKISVPNWEEIGMIADSSHWEKITEGNIDLLPYAEKTFNLSFNHTFKEKFYLNISAKQSYYQNKVIEESSINSELGNLYNSYVNNPYTSKELGINYSVFQINPKGNVSFSMIGGMSRLNSYLTFNEILANINSYLAFNNLNLKYRPQKEITINTNWQLQGYRIAKNNTWLQIFDFKTTWDMGKYWYFDTNSRILSSQNTQYFIDFELQKFCFKNNSLKVSFIAKNILDNIEEIKLTSTENSQTQASYTYLPRLFLLKLNYFPEKWK